MVDRNDFMEALIVGFGGLTLGSLSMFIPTDKKDKYLIPFVGIFMTGFLFHLLWKQFNEKIFRVNHLSTKNPWPYVIPSCSFCPV